MSNTELTHKPCPNPNCDSSDAFSYNTDKQVGHCHSCGKGYPQKGITYSQEVLEAYPLKQDWDKVHSQSEANAVSEGYHNHRSVTAKTMEVYGVVGTENYHKYIYPNGGYKKRTFPKNFTAHSISSDEFFGMNHFPAGCSPNITITEGELDALSAYQILNTSKYINPVVSLPSGTPSKSFWGKVRDYLNSFEKIILAIDNDEVGDEISNKFIRMFPNKVHKMSFPEGHKDPNDMLMKGKVQEFRNLWWNVKPTYPNNIRVTSEDFINLLNEEKSGVFVPTGIIELDEKLEGLAEGHYTLLKARTGIGKTELVRYLENNFLNRGVAFASWHLEESPLRSLLGLVSYDIDNDVTRKSLIKEKSLVEDVMQSIESISGKELYYQFNMTESCTTEDVIDQIRFMREAYGVRFIIIEPVQDVLNITDSSNKETLLSELAIRISKIAAETGVGVIMVAHTNDDNEIKYCRMLGQRASVVINLERDKTAEDETTRNTTQLFIEKNRPTSLEGHAGEVFFDKEKFQVRPF